MRSRIAVMVGDCKVPSVGSLSASRVLLALLAVILGVLFATLAGAATSAQPVAAAGTCSYGHVPHSS